MAPPLVVDLPASAAAFDAAGAVAQRQDAAARAKLPQKALVQRGDVHVERVLLDRRAGGVARTQRRHHAADFGGWRLAQARVPRPACAASSARCVRAREEHHGALRHQRHLGETRRRVLEERRDRPDSVRTSGGP